ncbi:MAG: M1 family aminopeptidase [Myxococcota bacterium]
MWLASLLPAFAGPLIRDGVPAPPAGVRYTLDLALSDVESRFAGTATVVVPNPLGAPLTTLPLVLTPNATTVPALSIDEAKVMSGQAATWAVGHPSELAVTFDPPLPADGVVTLSFTFHGGLRALPDDVNDPLAQGMSQLASLGGAGGGGDFGLLASGDGIVIAASAFPMVVPVVDGAFVRRVLRPDRPIGDLAWNNPSTFSARIVTPTGLTVVTNLVDRAAPSVAGGQVVVAEGSGVGDLVIVASRDWSIREQQVGGVRVRSFARSRDAVAGQDVLAAGVKSLTVLERYGRYPFTELDLVEASLVGGAGGVEFGSLAVIGGFLYRDPGASGSPMAALLGGLGGLGGAQGSGPSPAEEIARQRAFVVAHEVAHQWSPGLVGADAWTYPIVDEPLAQYLAWRVVTDGLSTASAAEVRGKYVSMNYGLLRLLGGRDGAADRPTSGFGSSLEYAGLVYGKAPGLYWALEGAVGRPALDRALTAAFRARAWRPTSPDAWLGALEAGGAKGAVGLGARWWREPHGDEDLGVDPGGRQTLAWMVGPQQAAQLDGVFSQLGMQPADLFRAFGGAAPEPAPGAALGGVSVDELLRQLK